MVALAKKGNEEAVTFLYETHVDSIFSYIRYRVASVEIAQDLTSEVFLRMVRGLPNYQDRGVPFRAWLFRIAAHRIVDHYRQHGKHVEMPVPEDFESADLDLLDEAVSKEETLRLRQALTTLPADYQDLLILRFVQNVPHTEIAEIMHKSAGALRSMQYRAVKALTQELARLPKNSTPLRGDKL
ncbi:MAG: RNA polymerase sigma factor [Chloroflexota bacterium]